MKFLYFVARESIPESVVAFTAGIVKRTDSTVTMLVVAKDTESLENLQEGIAAAERGFGKVPLEVKTGVGDPCDLMEREIEANGYDMVIMYVRQRRRVLPSSFRFLSQKIIKLSPIPIMLVRKTNLKLERLLICTGGQDISEPVIRLSAKLAGMAGLQTTLLYVSGVVPSMYTGMNVMEETLEDLLGTDTPLANHLRACAELLSENNVKAEIEIRHGDVAGSILNEAKEEKHDLIVLGSSENNSLAGMLLGNVTQQIINRAESAVLIVK